MSRRRRWSQNEADCVRIFGRKMPVRDRLATGGRTYLILDKLGSAGRERYMAFDSHAGPRGALRAILVLPDSPAARQHARILDNISCHNGVLPKVFDFRALRGKLYIVMEWVNGVDLKSFLYDVRAGRRPRVSPVEAMRLIRRLAHDLGQIHRKRRISHGDIKPANLIVAREPSRLVPIDFGSGWILQHTATRDPGDGVSAAYSAPELQRPGKSFVDVRCDQFSCGVVLYEMLTLVVPYEGLGGRAGLPGLVNPQQAIVVPASGHHPHRDCVPRAAWNRIDAFLATSLNFMPDARYPTPKAWLDAIDAVYESLRPRCALSPLNAGLTRVIEWLATRFGGRTDCRR